MGAAENRGAALSMWDGYAGVSREWALIAENAELLIVKVKTFPHALNALVRYRSYLDDAREVSGAKVMKIDAVRRDPAATKDPIMVRRRKKSR
jgi:hypothetical protein